MIDALARHLEARATLAWDVSERGPFFPRNNAHERYVESIDRPRNNDRANRILSALHYMRRIALQAEGALNRDILFTAQRLILGTQATFRTGPAFAKGGAERYELSDNTEKHFSLCLHESNDAEIHPLALAVRVYLDICFFHPFPDGNARAARMAFEFVTVKAGIGFSDLQPIFALSRNAGDVEGYKRFLAVVVMLAKPRSAMMAPKIATI